MNMIQGKLDKKMLSRLEITGLCVIFAILYFDINPPVNPAKASQLYYKAKSLDQEGQTEQALKVINRAIELNPQMGKAYLVKGTIIMKRDYQRYYAQEALRRALELPLDRENRARTHYNLGAYFLNYTYNQYSIFRAIPEFKKTIEVGSSYFDDDFDPHGALVDCYINIQEYDKALHYAQEGIKVDPQSAKRNFRLAEALYYTGDKESAMNIVENQIRPRDDALAMKFFSRYSF